MHASLVSVLHEPCQLLLASWGQMHAIALEVALQGASYHEQLLVPCICCLLGVHILTHLHAST